MNESNEAENIDRRAQILEAALQVFSTKGFHKATNKDIALAAGGISPGLIYWYFKDKQDLFFTLIRERVPIFEVVARPEQFMQMSPREALSFIARTFLAALRVPAHVAMFRLILGEITRFPTTGALYYQMVPMQVLDLLSRYLQHQVERGQLRAHDTRTAARSFMGMLIIHVLAREILQQPDAQSTSNEQIVVTVIDIFVRGLEI